MPVPQNLTLPQNPQTAASKKGKKPQLSVFKWIKCTRKITLKTQKVNAVDNISVPHSLRRGGINVNMKLYQKKHTCPQVQSQSQFTTL